MKKVLQLAVLCLVTFTNAQELKKDKLSIDKGTWVLGGNFSANFIENTYKGQSLKSEFNAVSISFFPNLGYVISKNLVTGLGLGYGFTKADNLSSNSEEIENSNSNNSNIFSVFPYVRGYFPVGEKLAFYAQGEARFSHGNTKSRDEITNVVAGENRFDEFFVGVRPGFTFFISEHFALEATLGSLGYTKSNSESKTESETFERVGESSRFNFNLNSSDFLFGLSYYF